MWQSIHVTVIWGGEYVKYCIAFSLFSKHRLQMWKIRSNNLLDHWLNQPNPNWAHGILHSKHRRKTSHVIYFLFPIKMLMFMQNIICADYHDNWYKESTWISMPIFRSIPTFHSLAQIILLDISCDELCGQTPVLLWWWGEPSGMAAWHNPKYWPQKCNWTRLIWHIYLSEIYLMMVCCIL